MAPQRAAVAEERATAAPMPKPPTTDNAAAAVVFTIVNRTSALNFPLSRICHNATTISVGEIMVIRLMMAARHRISNAANAATTMTTRATAALVNRNDMPEAATNSQNGLCHVSGRNR